MPYRELESFLSDLDGGEYSHTVSYAGGKTDVCGTFRYKISMPSVHSAPGAYPFDTSPWMLPPVLVNGVAQPNIVTVNNRSEYKALLKKHNLVEHETPGERRTMYEDKPEGDKTKMDSDVDQDMRMYNHMLKNPEARKKVIRDNISKSRSLLNGTA